MYILYLCCFIFSYRFLIAVIAIQLSAIAMFAFQQNRKVELVNALMEAYSVLVYCPLSSQCVLGVVVPGLRNLETLVNQCLPQQKDAVRSLLREAESRQDLSRPKERYCIKIMTNLIYVSNKFKFVLRFLICYCSYVLLDTSKIYCQYIIITYVTALSIAKNIF